MCAEASTVLRVVAADFFFNCWHLEISSDNHIWHIPRRVHYHAQGFRLKRSRISMLELKAVPQSCILYIICVKFTTYVSPSDVYGVGTVLGHVPFLFT
jgi:hypothetical protein